MRSYLSLIKFSHTVFALPFALIGYFLAVWHHQYAFSWVTLGLVLACMVFARSAAMAFNRYLDRDIDRLNPRTAVREIPAGIIAPKRALAFTIGSSLLFVVTTAMINPLCFYLSPIALAVVLGYSYTKRFTALCHLVLGLGLSLAPIGAYLAVSGSFHGLPVLFSLAVFCWVAGFDIIYALQDEAFDKQHALHSIPSALGKARALQVSRTLHVIAAVMLVLAGISGGFHLLYWLGTAVFTGLLIYQHSLVSPNDLSRVGMAFFTTNGIASVVFAIFVLTDMRVW